MFPQAQLLFAFFSQYNSLVFLQFVPFWVDEEMASVVPVQVIMLPAIQASRMDTGLSCAIPNPAPCQWHEKRSGRWPSCLGPCYPHLRSGKSFQLCSNYVGMNQWIQDFFFLHKQNKNTGWYNLPWWMSHFWFSLISTFHQTTGSA